MARFEIINGRDAGRMVRYSCGWTPSSDEDDDVFGFLDYAEAACTSSSSSDGSCSSGEWYAGEVVIDDDDCYEKSVNVEEQRAFWVSQEQLLQATLYRTSSLETKIRHATKQAIKDAENGGCSCSCTNTIPSSISQPCRICLQNYISNQLQIQGFNSSICKSKWRSSSDILSGEHTFLQVIDNSNPRRPEVKVIIELNFRVEFEMKASREYNELVSKLPEIYIGKSERLHELVKILCRAAKRCMKDRNMHIGPWRKERYMLAKWFGTCERVGNSEVLNLQALKHRPVKALASLLAYEMAEHCKGVKSCLIK